MSVLTSAMQTIVRVMVTAGILTAIGCSGQKNPARPSDNSGGSGGSTGTSTTYAIAGTVIDGHTRAPIAGVTVSIVAGPSQGRSTTTTMAGTYRLDNIAAGQQDVRAALSQYEAQTQTVTVGANATVDFSLTFKADAPTTPPANAPKIRALYLVPSDRQEKPIYADAIARALRGLQVFYRSQMGDGTAFVLSSPVVETYHTSHPADWYKGAGTFGSMFSQGTAEARNVAGVINGTVVIYIDADIACGDSGSGGRAGSFGAAVLPANDLRGLASEPLVAICPNDSTRDVGFCRWVGGLGHELGHAMGLPHPADCQAGAASCVSKALMWLGYVSYPDALLLDADKQTLRSSGLFVPYDPGQVPVCF